MAYPLSQQERLDLYSSFTDSSEIGDTKYENGILYVYTMEGWVEQEQELVEPEPIEKEEAVVEEEEIIIPKEEEDEEKKELQALIESITEDTEPVATEEEKAVDIPKTKEPTSNDIIDEQLPYREIDIQIANVEDLLEDVDVKDKTKINSLNKELRQLNRKRDSLLRENKEQEITDNMRNILFDTDLQETETIEPEPSEKFLNYDTSNIRTLDDYKKDPITNKVAYDFWEEYGRTFWFNSDAGNIMHFFREEYSLDDLIRRANADEWSDEQKQRYIWLKDVWQETSFRDSSAKEKYFAVTGVGSQILTDPFNWATLFLLPETGGGSVAANVTAKTAAQATLKQIMLNSLKTKTINTETVKQIGKSLISTPAKSTATISAGYGVTYDTLLQSAEMDLNQREERSYFRTATVGTISAIMGGTLGKVSEKVPIITEQTYNGIKNSKVAESVVRAARFADETSGGTLTEAVRLMNRGYSKIASNTFGKDLTQYRFIGETIDAVRPILNAINSKWSRVTTSGKTDTSTSKTHQELTAMLSGNFFVRLKNTLHPLRKGLRRKLAERAPDISRWQVIRDNVFTFESIAFGLDDYTNSILAQAIRSTDLGGVPLLTKGFTSPITGNKIAVWSKNGDFTPSFKNVIREASEGKYTTGEFKTVVLEIRKLEDLALKLFKRSNRDAPSFITDAAGTKIRNPNKLEINPVSGHFPREWLAILKQAPSKWNSNATKEGTEAKNLFVSELIRSKQVIIKNKNGTINKKKTQEKADELYDELVAPDFYKQKYGVGSITNNLFARTLDKVDDTRLLPLLNNNVEQVYMNYFQKLSGLIAEETKFGLPTQPKLLLKELPDESELTKFLTVQIPGSKVGWRLAQMREQAQKEIANLPEKFRNRWQRRFEKDLDGIIKSYHYTVGNVPRIKNPYVRTTTEVLQVGVQMATLPLATLTSISEAWIPLARVDAPTYAQNMFKVFALQGKRIVRNIYNVLDLDQTTVANLKVPVSVKDGKSIFSIEKGMVGTAKETSREGKKIGSWLNNTEAFEEANKIMLFMDQATMQRVATLYSAEFQNMYTKGFQRFFFRANLLSEWTRTVELAAFLMGKDMIKTNLTKINKGGYTTGTIKRYKDELAELGIKDNLLPDGIKYIQGKGSAKQRQLFEEEITKSGGRFAREVILNPKVNQETALWLQNPHTAIFTQLLAYPFAFGNTVTKRFAQGMFKGPTNTARTVIAGSLMTMTGIIGNEWRTGGGRLPTPYDPTAKTMDYEHQDWHDVLTQGIRRWGGFAHLEFLYNIERNLKYSSWGDRKRPLDATKGLLGPLGGDVVDMLTGKRTWKQTAIEKLPGFTAYPKEIQAKLRQAAKEGKVLDQETIQWIFGYIDGLNREEELIKEIEEQKWERERVQKFTGGAISEDYPVPNVIKNPSERIDPNTGLPYDEPLERLGFSGGGLLNGVEDPLARLGFTGGGLNSEEVKAEPLLQRILQNIVRASPEEERELSETKGYENTPKNKRYGEVKGNKVYIFEDRLREDGSTGNFVEDMFFGEALHRLKDTAPEWYDRLYSAANEDPEVMKWKEDAYQREVADGYKGTREQHWNESRFDQVVGGFLLGRPDANVHTMRGWDRNTLPYGTHLRKELEAFEKELGRTKKKDGGLMVSIGVAPVSEKQMSKFEKALKKRKAKREGGRIGLAEGESAREQRIKEREERDVTRKEKEQAFIKGIDESLNPLQKASLIPVPIASDIAGVAGDIQMYRKNPETKTLGNYALTGLGALPFVPSAAGYTYKLAKKSKSKPRAKRLEIVGNYEYRGHKIEKDTFVDDFGSKKSNPRYMKKRTKWHIKDPNGEVHEYGWTFKEAKLIIDDSVDYFESAAIKYPDELDYYSDEYLEAVGVIREKIKKKTGGSIKNKLQYRKAKRDGGSADIEDIVVKALKRIPQKGKEAYEYAIDKMGENNLDKQFLKEIAYVESKYAEDKGSFRKGNRSAYQITPLAFQEFKETINPNSSRGRGLRAYANKIKDRYDVDISKVTYDELNDPLIGTAVTRALWKLDPEPIGNTVKERANQWKRYWNTEEGKGTVDRYLDDVTFMNK